MKQIFTVILALSALFSGAQEKQYNIEKVEITGRTKTSEAAMQRVVIDTTIMRAFQSSSLGDLLSQNSPIAIKTYGRGDMQVAAFRGTGASHTLVHWNGVRLNSPMEGAVDFSLIPVFFIDKLSVDAGVSSMATASGALGGSVNLESMPQWNKRFGVEAVQSVGSFSTTDSYLNIKAGSNKFQSSTKFYLGYSKNDFEFINPDIKEPGNPGYVHRQKNENGDWRNRSFMQEFYLRIDSAHMLSASVWGLENNRNIPQLTTYEVEEGSAPAHLTNRKDGALRAAVTYKQYGRRTNLTARLTGDVQSMVFTKESKMGAGYLTTIDSHGLSRSVSGSVDAMTTLDERHSLQINGGAIVDYVDSRDKGKTISDGQENINGFQKTRANVYAMAAFHSQWNNRLITSATFRGQIIGSRFYLTPFAGAEYRLSESFSVKARAGYNIHEPSLTDMYYVPGGNEDLRAERSLTVEAGVLFSKNDTKIELNFFNSWISDWIIWLPSHHQYWKPENLKKVLSQGFELSVSKQWSWGDWGLYANGNFNLNRTVNNTKSADSDPDADATLGKQMPFVPLVKGGVFVKGSWKKLWLSYQIYGENEKYATTSNNKSSLNVIAPFNLSDVALGYGWRYFSLEARCRNLFDSQYYTVLRRPLPGRSFELMLRFKI